MTVTSLDLERLPVLSTPQSVNLAEKERDEALDSQDFMQTQAASGRSTTVRALALPSGMAWRQQLTCRWCQAPGSEQ